MNKYDRKFNSSDYVPKRFGLRYNPPQIVLEYLTPSTGKLYHHKIKFHKMKQDSQLAEVIKEIYEKHYMYLDNKKVNPNQIIKLVEKLKSNIKPTKVKENESNTAQPQKIIQENNNTTKKPEEQKSTKEIATEALTKKKSDINELEDEIEEEYKFDNYDEEDLNKLSTEELKKRKNEMEKIFEQKAIRPDDDNFVFDVRKDFDNDKFAAEWDDESNDSY